MAASADVPYSFRNRVTLTFGTRFASDQSQVKLSAEDAAENVLLHTPNLGDPIGDATELVISGGGYGSFDEAEQAGKRWRQHLTVALARFGIGADLGPATDVQARRGDGLIGEQFYEDRPGLQVLEYEAGAMFLRSSVDLIRKRPLGNFLNGPLRSELEKSMCLEPIRTNWPIR